MNKDPTKELASMLASGWKVASMSVSNDGTNSRGRAVVYTLEPESWRERNRQRQAAGVKFEFNNCYGWCSGKFEFTHEREKYREVPQPIPHKAERALWKAQREAGTNEVWLEQASDNNGCWWEVDNDFEPEWIPKHKYRVKPMKLTAKICQKEILYKTVQDWEFTGTREEYRAECEKYGYAVVSEIKEVVEKPRTVKCYMAMFTTPDGKPTVVWNKHKSSLLEHVRKYKHTLVGEIEEREVAL